MHFDLEEGSSSSGVGGSYFAGGGVRFDLEEGSSASGVGGRSYFAGGAF